MGNAIPAGCYARLEVADDGCGMDEEIQRRIFEPFFTTKFTGRGLGMSAILGIVKSHEGALQMSSSPGKGSNFVVYFPVPVENEQTEGACMPCPAPSTVASGFILLVDDEDGLRAIGAALLSAMGFSVVTASNGREAIEVYRERSAEIDVILLDLVMPEMGGVEAYQKLRGINRQVPVLICSGYGIEGVLDSIDADRNVRCIQKPYKPEQLRSTILDVLESRST